MREAMDCAMSEYGDDGDARTGYTLVAPELELIVRRFSLLTLSERGWREGFRVPSMMRSLR